MLGGSKRVTPPSSNEEPAHHGHRPLGELGPAQEGADLADAEPRGHRGEVKAVVA